MFTSFYFCLLFINKFYCSGVFKKYVVYPIISFLKKENSSVHFVKRIYFLYDENNVNLIQDLFK